MYSRRKLKHWRRRKNELEKMGMRYNEGRYKLSCVVRQDPAHHVYCCALNTVHPAHADTLATPAGPRAYVYRLTPDGGVKLTQCYVDEDDEEDYFACCWCSSAARETSGRRCSPSPAGTRASSESSTARRPRRPRKPPRPRRRRQRRQGPPLRRTSCSPPARTRAAGCGDLDSAVCVAVFAGEFGHRNEVLSVDFKPGVDPYDASEREEPGGGSSGDGMMSEARSGRRRRRVRVGRDG